MSKTITVFITSTNLVVLILYIGYKYGCLKCWLAQPKKLKNRTLITDCSPCLLTGEKKIIIETSFTIIISFILTFFNEIF